MITFSRASSGTALAKISYGPELVTNGTFDTDFSGWTVVGQQPTVVNSQLRLTTSSANVGVNQDVGLQVGKMYLASYDIISITGGAMRLALGSAANGTNRTAPGSYSELLYVSGDTVARLYQVTSFSSEVIVVDNISIKEVLYDQAGGTLQLFNHPTNQPRVEYDYQGNRLGLLVEEARTNRLPQSNDLLTWTKTAVSYSQNADGPLGVGTATTITATAGTAAHWYYVQTGANSVDQCNSLFVKAGTVDFVCISSAAPGSDGVWFDLTNGQVGTANGSSSGTIKYWGDGWYRCAAVIPTATYVTVHLCRQDGELHNFSADGTETILVCGHQAELGSFPTSYIPTSGATATRSADVASINVGSFGYNKGAGSFVVAGQMNAINYSSRFVVLSDTTANNRILMAAGNSFHGYMSDNGSQELNLSGGISAANEQQKVSFAWKKDNAGVSLNGGAVVTDTSVTIPTGISRLSIGSNSALSTVGSASLHISSIAYYPRRLTDAQIKALTSPPETPTLSLSFDGSSTSYLETNIHG
jgi:hypothetical protein